jgi:hypothetical protein
MFARERVIPLKIKQIEALLRNLRQNHFKEPFIQQDNSSGNQQPFRR